MPAAVVLHNEFPNHMMLHVSPLRGVEPHDPQQDELTAMLESP